jgi:hypothetical protein
MLLRSDTSASCGLLIFCRQSNAEQGFSQALAYTIAY